MTICPTIDYVECLETQKHADAPREMQTPYNYASRLRQNARTVRGRRACVCRRSSIASLVGYRFTIIETLATKNQINIAAWPTKGAYPEAV